MEPVSDPEISKEYETRRLDGLRQLVYEFNEKIRQKPQPFMWLGLPIDNPYITEIDTRTADYLYFSLLIRSKRFDIQIPEFLGYGFHYDELFKRFSNSIYQYSYTTPSYRYFIEKNIPYLMLTNPEELWFLYPSIYKKSKNVIIEILTVLKNAFVRDSKLDYLINRFDSRLRREGEEANDTYRDIINMMKNEEFDILDSVYILLYPGETLTMPVNIQEIEQFILYIRK